jgi:hypothetical protein
MNLDEGATQERTVILAQITSTEQRMKRFEQLMATMSSDHPGLAGVLKLYEEASGQITNLTETLTKLSAKRPRTGPEIVPEVESAR